MTLKAFVVTQAWLIIESILYQTSFSTLTYPLRQLTRKNTKFVWTNACENSFNILNNLLTDTSVNTYLNEQKKRMLYCYASPFRLSLSLLQNDNKDHLQVTLYLSRSLNTSEQDTHNQSESCLVLFMHVYMTEFIYFVAHLRYTVTIKHSLIYKVHLL